MHTVVILVRVHSGTSACEHTVQAWGNWGGRPGHGLANICIPFIQICTPCHWAWPDYFIHQVHRHSIEITSKSMGDVGELLLSEIKKEKEKNRAYLQKVLQKCYFSCSARAII